MKLIADTVLTHRNNAGQTYLVAIGQEFEIADAAGEILVAAGEAHAPKAKVPTPAEQIVEQTADKAIDAIGAITDLDLLRAVGTAEAAGKNRTTVLAAVSARGTALTQSSQS